MADKNKKEILGLSRYAFRFLIWIYLLTAIAGAVNIYGIKMLGFKLSHHTGNTSQIAISIYEGRIPFSLIFMLIAFFFGSFFSGTIFHQRRLDSKRSYDKCLYTCGLFLVFLSFLTNKTLELFSLCFILGLQNGMFIKYREVVVRTSHITGYLTDAGFALGALIRGNKSELWKIKFYITSILSFIGGGLGGYFLVNHFSSPIRIIGGFYILAGMYYYVISEKN